MNQGDSVLMAKFDYRTVLRDELRELKPYAPEPGKCKVRLDANEAPAFLSSEAKKGLAEVAINAELTRYPKFDQRCLKKSIATQTGIDPEQVICGVGSDELISLLLTVATRLKDRAPAPTIISATPTFGMYRLAARLRGQRVMEVPLDQDWELNLEGMIRAIEISDPNIIFLASPNNPTGKTISKQCLQSIAEAAQNALVVIDESYVAYAESDHLSLLEKFENIILLRSLSKVGFAGLRVGWLIGHPALVAELEKARLPYNLATIVLDMASYILSELGDEMKKNSERVKAAREEITQQLQLIEGINVIPSEANFLWVELNQPSSHIYEQLKRKSILVRSFHGRGGRLERCIRVTVGNDDENTAFIDAFKDAL